MGINGVFAMLQFVLYYVNTSLAMALGPRQVAQAIWGSYGYDSKYDVVRVPMTMVRVPASHEQFTIGFVDMTDKGGKIAMVWEHTGATVPFTVTQ